MIKNQATIGIFLLSQLLFFRDVEEYTGPVLVKLGRSDAPDKDIEKLRAGQKVMGVTGLMFSKKMTPSYTAGRDTDLVYHSRSSLAQ